MPPDLRLGARRYDLAHRALVLAVVGTEDPEPALTRAADGHLAAGADGFVVGRPTGRDGETVGEDEELERSVPVVECLAARFDAPVAVQTGRPEVLRAAAKAGAVAAEDPGGFSDRAYPSVAADLGLTVIVRVGRSAAAGRLHAEAVSGGLRADEIVLAASLSRVADLAAAGHRVMMADEDPQPGSWPAVAALAVTRGARLVRTGDVAATVRVVRMLERILSA